MYDFMYNLSQVLQLNRRNLLKQAAKLGVVAGLAPAISHYGLASSGQLDLIGFDDSFDPAMLKRFKQETGIKVIHKKITSNTEIVDIITKTRGVGYDLIAPTCNENLVWQQMDYLLPLELESIEHSIQNIRPFFYKYALKNWNFGNGLSWLPHIWGTEAIGYNQKKLGKNYVPSYSDMFKPEYRGQVIAGEYNLLFACAIYLEYIRVLPKGGYLNTTDNVDNFENYWQPVLQFAVSKKGQFFHLWKNGVAEQKKLMQNPKFTLGVVWDGAPLSLNAKNNNYRYGLPVEGAMAFIDGIALVKYSNKISEATAFINFLLSPKNAGTAIKYHHYNSVIDGAELYAGKEYLNIYNKIYNPDSLENLNFWPNLTPLFNDLYAEYIAKFKNA